LLGAHERRAASELLGDIAMSMTVEELVLDAFRVEYKEQLEQLRTLVTSWRLGAPLSNEAGVREAFRLAHSFKGGARVCGLDEAERLGHGLETVLERLDRGELPFDSSVLIRVTTLLDSIEDWMSAFDQELPPPDISAALDCVEQSAGEKKGLSVRLQAQDRTPQLLPVFLREQEEHLARIRQFLEHWRCCGESLPAEELTEAARVAHTLAGAAAVVELRTVESLASQVEQLLRAVRENQRQLDETARQEIADCLVQMARTVHGVETKPVSPAANVGYEIDSAKAEPPHKLASDVDSEQVHDAISASTPRVTSTHDTVRVTVESLDRLMRSSSELLAGNQEVARLTRELTDLQRDVNELERERDTVRRAASPALHRLAEFPEFDRISRYLDFVDRQVSCVAKRARQIVGEQRGAAWRFRARSAKIQSDVQAARLVPAHSMFQGFRKMVRDLAKSEDKLIEFQASGMDVRADRMVLQELKDPIMHVLRNCVSHGIERPERRRDAGKTETGRVAIALETSGGHLHVTIEDDGQGIDASQIQRQAIRQGLLPSTSVAELSTEDALSLAFAPGLSTAAKVTELAGRGMGLSIVHDAVSRLQGRVSLSNRSDGGVRVDISVPIFISTHRILLVAVGKQIFAVPTRGIERLLRIPAEKIELIEGRPVVTYDDRPVRLVALKDALGLAEAPFAAEGAETTSVVMLKSGSRLLAVSVDALVEERDALMLNLDELAESDQFSGGVSLEDGTVALVIQVAAIMEDVHRIPAAQMPTPCAKLEPAAPARLLIVDDSFTTRTLEKNILEAQGYEVCVAVDGIEALSLLRQQRFALVVTDIEMPRMDGFALLEQMKAENRLAKTPVILVTSRDRQEDQQHGLDLGADAYIVKRKFDHQELLCTIRQLL
jgi:two-component system chemotaxis sensor kinase CheA